MTNLSLKENIRNTKVLSKNELPGEVRRFNVILVDGTNRVVESDDLLNALNELPGVKPTQVKTIIELGNEKPKLTVHKVN